VTAIDSNLAELIYAKRSTIVIERTLYRERLKSESRCGAHLVRWVLDALL